MPMIKVMLQNHWSIDNFDMNTETLWYALNNKKTYKDVMVESAYEEYGLFHLLKS